MPFKPIDIDLADAFSRYQAGEHGEDLAREMGISGTTFDRRLKAAGFTLRTQGQSQRVRYSRAHPLPNLGASIDAYAKGMSMKDVCKSFPGVSRQRIERCFVDAGVKLRRVSDTKKFLYAGMTIKQRRAVTMAANAAKRGRPASELSLEKRAITMERTMQLAGRTDLVFSVWLAQRSIGFTMQKAAGRYNIDIAIHEPRIAIEIDGERHHFSETAILRGEKKIKFLLDRGWRVIEIRLKASRYLLRETTADYVVSLIEQARRNEPTWGKHCVIWGNGDPISGIEDQGDDGSSIFYSNPFRYVGSRNLCISD